MENARARDVICAKLGKFTRTIFTVLSDEYVYVYRATRDVTTPLFTVEIYTLGTPFNLSANVQFYSDIERRIDAMKYFVDIYVAI